MPEQALSIAFVVDRFGARYGGAEAYGVELMRELVSQGHRVKVFARAYDKGCDLKLDFEQIRLASCWPSWLRVLLFAYKAARLTKNGFDIVHSHMNGWCGDVEVVHVTPVRYRWRIQEMPGHKRLLAYLSPRVWCYLGLEARRVRPRSGHRLVAVSGLIAQQLERAYKLSAGLPIIPPGVTAAKAADADSRQALRQQLGLSSEIRLCLLVARNPMRKGLDTVVKALELMPERVHLLVVGSDRHAHSHLEQAPEAIRQRVHLLGQTSNVGPYYRGADVYVHPTRNDSFGMAPLEAMSFGLPVVLSPAPWCGFAQYLSAGEDALLLKHPEDSAELAQAVLKLLDDQVLRAKIINGANAVVQRHSWPTVAQRFSDLYQQILQERTAQCNHP